MNDYERIEKAIKYLEENYKHQPSLQELADHVSLSPFHTQRLFKRWAGITPKQFTQFLTIDYAKSVLDNSGSLLAASYDAGLSGPGRLHDLFVTFEAVTPGEYKRRGENLNIRYGLHPTQFGQCLLGITERGISWLSFFGNEGPERSLDEMSRQWGGARIQEDDQSTRGIVDTIFAEGIYRDQKPLTLYLRGTNFQIKVWEALLKLPPGGLFTYEELSAAINRPAAVRAVASAVGRNPISFLIPCHRILRKSGRISGYRWGPIRKKAIIAWEAAQTQATSDGDR